MNDNNKTYNFGEIVISAIYMKSDIDDSLVEINESLHDIYDLFGSKTTSSVIKNTYFGYTLSAPFKFTENGLYKIFQQLASFEEINKESIAIKELPNIPISFQDQFETDQLNNILINEKYVSFSFKEFSNVEVMIFPTHCVLNYYFLPTSVVGLNEYQTNKMKWQEFIDYFFKLKNLRQKLSLLNENVRVSSLPRLYMVSFQYFDYDTELKYMPNIKLPPDENKFLNEIGVRKYSDISGIDLNYFDSWFYENNFTGSSRYYYKSGSWFKDFNRIDQKIYEEFRVIRLSLITNVIMPYYFKKLEMISKDLLDRKKIILQKRLDLTSEVSPKKLQEYDNFIQKHLFDLNVLENLFFQFRALSKIDGDIKRYFNNPWSVPDNAKNINISDEFLENYKKFFNFNEMYNLHNDKWKFDLLNNKMQNLYPVAEEYLIKYSNELSSLINAVDTRRGINSGTRNTILSIIIPAACAVVAAIIWLAIWSNN